MSYSDRYNIAPQMRDYDQIGEHWVPYLMWFHTGKINLPSVSTDEYGLRVSIDKDGMSPITYNDFKRTNRDRFKKGLLLGASTAFGVGATSDSMTIPSLLNQNTEMTWFNLGGRAFNSTQELLLFQLHLLPVDEVVILSGVNNLTLSYLSETTSEVYNSFYNQSNYYRAMELAKHSESLRSAVKSAASVLINKIGRRPNNGVVRSSIKARYQNIMLCTKRDMTILKALGDSLNFKLNYVLQPIATWMQKDFSEEELQIFAVLDALGRDWEVLSKYINEMKQTYIEDLEGICKELEITFLDLNTREELYAKEWMFVDRVHLSDNGNSAVSNIIAESLR